MNADSFLPFLLLVAPFAIASLLEAIVIYFFKLRLFWPSIGFSLLVNILSLCVLYASSLLMTKLGYEFNGLRLPLQVLLALWWVSVMTDGLLLQLFLKSDRKKIYTASIAMNSLSFLFLYFFVMNSH